MFWSLLLLTLASAAPVDNVPEFVSKYAPILRLYSTDQYGPADIATQIAHTTPMVDGKSITGPAALSLSNLDSLNSLGGSGVYLTSNEGILALPSWFNGGIPNYGIVPGKTSAVILIDKPSAGDGITDVFYFYFYAYDRGNDINIFGRDLGPWGNHVGDWEHTAVRFRNGEPQSVWLSQHADGQAFAYSALEKNGDRPVIYVGNGTHANWAIDGPHEHTIPGLSLPFKGLLTDWTDRGPWYDSLQSSYFYKYDGQTFTSYDSSPTNWLLFQGQWGDQQLADNTPGQMNLFGQRKYVGGPNGPIFKDLMRQDICPTKKDRDCIVRPIRMPK